MDRHEYFVALGKLGGRAKAEKYRQWAGLCSRCRKPVGPNRTNAYCKPCSAAIGREWWAKNNDHAVALQRRRRERARKEKEAYENTETRICSVCGATKVIAQFRKRGDASKCKRCTRKAALAKWYRKHADRIALWEKAHRAKPEVRERIRVKARERYASSDKYRRAGAVAQSLRYHRKRAPAPAERVTPRKWTNILRSYGSMCIYCGSRHKLTIEHVDALKVGGTHTEDNLAPACGKCNSSKGAKSLVVFLATRK